MLSDSALRHGMKVSRTAQTTPDFTAPGYDAYAQLVTMLLPSSGCLAIYTRNGDLIWCSDGFERPEFRELIDEIKTGAQELGANEGTIRKTRGGVSVLLAKLCKPLDRVHAYALIELDGAHADSARSMATSLTRPLLACLASQLALERDPAAQTRPTSVDDQLELLLGVAEADRTSTDAIRRLLEACINRLDCVSAAFCVPVLDRVEVAERETLNDDAARARLDETRKHLLAWVQLNNRPMVVNRIDSTKGPYKILSCPVPARNGTAAGLFALFRTAPSADFKLADVRLVRSLSEYAMNLLNEQQDDLTGLLSRGGFERRLETICAATPRGPDERLLYLDIEALSAINDAFGYAVGDEAIRRAAQVIRRALRPTELAGRLGGDRFVVYLPERDAEQARALGTDIVTAARDRGLSAGQRRVPLILRFGIMERSADAPGARYWIAAAERACRPASAARGANPYNSPGVDGSASRESE